MGFRERMYSGLIKTALYFERLYPRYIKYFISRSLKKLKERGVISDYKVKSRRKNRYHYVFEIDLYKKINGGENA